MRYPTLVNNAAPRKYGLLNEKSKCQAQITPMQVIGLEDPRTT